MNRILVVIISLFSLTQLTAQQEYQVSHNMFNNAAINPAAAGVNESLCAYAIGRLQWMGFGDGAPETYILNANTPLSLFASTDLPIGLGTTMALDRIGDFQTVLAKASVNYQLGLQTGSLSFGLDLGLQNTTFNGTPNPNDQNDPLIPGLMDGPSSSTPLLGFGVFYNASDLYFGISSSQLIESSLDWGTAEPVLRRHYYISGGYESQPIGPVVLKPSVFIKTDGAVTTMDIGAIAEYESMLWAGATYRTGDAVVALFGYNLSQYNVKIGVAYDITTSQLNQVSNGSTEVFLRYCKPLKSKVKTTRFVDPTLLQ